MFKNKNIIYITDYKIMNKHLKYCKENRLLAPSEDWARMQRIPSVYYTISVMYTRIILRYQGNGNPYTEYIFNLDGGKNTQQISGLRTYNLLQRLSHKGVVDLSNNWKYYDKDFDCWKIGHIAGLIYFNPKYNGQRFENCYEYDRNNSYSAAMLEDIPDTRVEPRMYGTVGKGEIGFREMTRGYTDEIFLYAVFEEGFLADYIFPAMESPFKKFVEFYYNKREKTKNKMEQEKMKQILNYSIGYIRRKNPFVHSCILSRARYYIEELIDENTLYSNTDSIVSLGRRVDLDKKLGHNIGDFKIKHKGSFAYNNSGYQWNKEIPSVRGRSKEWFKNAFPNGFDLLTDKLPYIEANKFIFNEEKGEIEYAAKSVEIKEQI